MIPDLPGREHLISSNECFLLEQLPASIVIIGAGYIGMEFASIFRGLGVHVTVLYRGEQILRDFDSDLRDGLAEAMRNRGIDLRMDTDVASDREGRAGLPRPSQARRFRRRRSRHGGDRAHAQHLGAWARAARRRARAERAGRGGRVLQELGGQYLCRGRRDRPQEPDAGRHPRRERLRRNRCSTTRRPRSTTAPSRRRCSPSPRSARSGSPRRRRARCTGQGPSTSTR